jgi:hypothetical protein
MTRDEAPEDNVFKHLLERAGYDDTEEIINHAAGEVTQRIQEDAEDAIDATLNRAMLLDMLLTTKTNPRERGEFITDASNAGMSHLVHAGAISLGIVKHVADIDHGTNREGITDKEKEVMDAIYTLASVFAQYRQTQKIGNQIMDLYEGDVSDLAEVDEDATDIDPEELEDLL